MSVFEKLVGTLWIDGLAGPGQSFGQLGQFVTPRERISIAWRGDREFLQQQDEPQQVTEQDTLLPTKIGHANDLVEVAAEFVDRARRPDCRDPQLPRPGVLDVEQQFQLLGQPQRPDPLAEFILLGLAIIKMKRFY